VERETDGDKWTKSQREERRKGRTEEMGRGRHEK
jgi:hypothetical protein